MYKKNMNQPFPWLIHITYLNNNEFFKHNEEYKVKETILFNKF
jgi:hypothetical protein